MSTSDGTAGLQKPVTITVDGQRITAEAGAPLLQVALDHGIQIPHYCYHPKLSIDGSCRMCQVKIEKAPKLAISCNTPITDGMVVDTQGAEVERARRGVMELLLINHPLDCPICDQAGECFLQDYSFGYGRGDARTSTPRRKGPKRVEIGPRVVFDQERCILCRRCVRFTKEISETEELRVFGIGDRSHIGTFPGKPLDNDYSINTADICPVGALLSKEFHHRLRVWFLEETESVCASCSNGCNVKIGAYRNQIWRMVPRRNDAVNDTWMCDHGRLNFGYVHDPARIRIPTVRRPGRKGAPPEAIRTNIDDAIESAAALLRQTLDAHGPQAIGVIGSPHLTNEESFRLARLVREAIGTPNFDLVVPLGKSDDFLIKAEKAANARGARDVGVAPGAEGKDAAAMLAAAAASELKLLFVVGSGDVVGVLGEEAVDRALGGLASLIVQDVLPSRMTERADVVLPGLTWAEKDGSFTNHAGRVQRIRKAIAPVAESLSDGEIFTRLHARLRAEGARDATFEPRAALSEVASAVPRYQGLSFDRLGSLGVPSASAAESGSRAAVAQAAES
ncbi:MAG TPA: 2Fe-2S iron-sulfur cluster-binding protein [Candidatus Bathyarchaeia archaeon]|nr:2Fe-2S iron-sulfur cluster-binding protein [Candidatus Bathyarchaeia archaeon]